jgi:hypothetical protein
MTKIEVDQFGFRVGSQRSKAAALYVHGATSEEVKVLTGHPQLTMLAELEAKGFTIIKSRVRVSKNRPHLRYQIKPKEP